jgi:uncharacterized protein YbgA (DUF1722 family)/uncharacterized protein YbbK (DUF523 family)
VSRCLGFEPVRYNGQIVRDDFVQKLAGLCDPVVVCPEVEIGLGVPRPPIRLVRGRGRGGTLALVQPDTGRDVTDAMEAFASRFLDGVPAADGFVLKSRSPSCGIRDVKVYGSADQTAPLGKTAGAFGKRVVERFPAAAVEDEGRLNDDALRERFLTLLFALARLREVERSGERSALVDFHARHKYALLAYEERGMRELGKVVAAVAEQPWGETIALYRERFARAFARPARVAAHVNALQHAFGHVSEGLSAPERAFFLEQLGELRSGRLPLSGTLTLLRSWVLRFDADYVGRQAYLEPYPRELVG